MNPQEAFLNLSLVLDILENETAVIKIVFEFWMVVSGVVDAGKCDMFLVLQWSVFIHTKWEHQHIINT